MTIGRRQVTWLALIVATSGCNADQEPAGASTGGAAGSSAGAAGAGAAGAGGGVAGSGGAGSDLDGSSDRDAARRSFGIFVGSDFIGNQVKLTAVDWASHAVAGSTLIPTAFADAVPFAERGGAFLLERSASKLLLLDRDQPWLGTASIDLAASDDSGIGTNPVAVVYTGTNAYVPLYFANSIAVVDVAQKKVTGAIDLSRFADASDSDGRVDVFDGTYDASARRAYFLLQRIPQFERGIDPDRASPCLPVTPLIIAVDTTNDSLVDLDGDGGNGALALIGANPTAFVPDLAAGRLLVVDAGCYDPPEGGIGDGGPDAQASLPREGRGIEALTLASGASAWLYRHTGTERLSGMVLVDATHAFVSTDDASLDTHWHAWDPSMPTLGAQVTSFPKFGPRLVGPGQIVGLSHVDVDAGTANALVSFDVASGQTTTLVSDIFGDPKYDGRYNGWALLQ